MNQYLSLYTFLLVEPSLENPDQYTSYFCPSPSFFFPFPFRNTHCFISLCIEMHWHSRVLISLVSLSLPPLFLSFRPMFFDLWKTSWKELGGSSCKFCLVCELSLPLREITRVQLDDSKLSALSIHQLSPQSMGYTLESELYGFWNIMRVWSYDKSTQTSASWKQTERSSPGGIPKTHGRPL